MIHLCVSWVVSLLFVKPGHLFFCRSLPYHCGRTTPSRTKKKQQQQLFVIVSEEYLTKHEQGADGNSSRASLSIRETSVKCCWPLKTTRHRQTCHWCLKLSLWLLLVLVITVSCVVVTFTLDLGDFSVFKHCDVENNSGETTLNATTLPVNGSETPVCYDFAIILVGKLFVKLYSLTIFFVRLQCCT